jgi:hypothetical protein
MKLLKSQKNEMYDIIQSLGLSPNQFQFREELFLKNDELYSTKFNLRKKKFFFLIRPVAYDDTYIVTYIPALHSYKFESRIRIDDWNEIRHQFETWVKSVTTEMNEVDKWKSKPSRRIFNMINTFKFW